MPKIILKPCPFCGQKQGHPLGGPVRMLPQYNKTFGLYYQVICDCGASKTCFTKSKKQMAAAWNVRLF